MKLLLLKLCNYFTTLTLHHVEVVCLLSIPLAERLTGRGPSPLNHGDFLCFEAASWIASHLLNHQLGPWSLPPHEERNNIFTMTWPKYPGRASILFLTLCKELFKFAGSYKSGQSQKGIFHFYTVPPYLKWNSARRLSNARTKIFKIFTFCWHPLDNQKTLNIERQHPSLQILLLEGRNGKKK